MRRSPFSYRHTQGHISRPLWQLVKTIQHRIQDAKAEVHLGETLIMCFEQRVSWRWRICLTLASALTLLSIAFAFVLSRQNGADLSESFFPAIGLIFALPAWRLLAPTPSRNERIYLLCLFGMACYLVRVL